MGTRVIVSRGGPLVNSRASQHLTLSRASYASVAGTPFSSASPESDTSHKPVRGSERTAHRPRYQTPRTETDDEDVYILTLHTNADHHQRMTALRKKYFPPSLNKVDAHITLFHALPGSKLDSTIIPAIEQLASKTPYFNITAKQPARLGPSVAIQVPLEDGSSQINAIRDTLQLAWKPEGFLSQQDAKDKKLSPFHYTVANKLKDQAAIQKVETELRETFVPEKGVVSGLRLYRYAQGPWILFKQFNLLRPRGHQRLKLYSGLSPPMSDDDHDNKSN